MLIKYLISLNFIFIPQYSFSKVIALGKASQSNAYEDYLKRNPQFTSLQQSIINQNAKRTNEEIQQKHKLAVNGLYYIDLKPAIYLFKELSDFSRQDVIVNKESHQHILESHYRLSNLERNNADYWIRQAVILDPAYTPSDEVFNPIIMEKFQKIKSEKLPYFYSWYEDDLKLKNSFIYLNGRPANHERRIFPSQRYRLKVFKDGHSPLSEEKTGAELLALKKLKLNKLDLGSCAEPNFKTINGIKVQAIFFSNDCIAIKKDPKAEVKPLLLPKKTNLISRVKAYNKKPAPVAKPKPKPKSFFQKKSTWIVIAGTVASAAVIYAIKESQKSPKIVPVQL